jgi:hypothetical protein
MSRDCPVWVQSEDASDVPSVASGLIEFQLFVYKNSKKYILQHGDLKTWHRKIFRFSVPLDYYAGNYRSDDPRYPCLHADVEVGGLQGAPFAEVPTLMRELSGEMHHYIVETDKYVQRGPAPVNRVRSVLQLASLCSGEFLKIHPFLNCNGRTSRLISNYIFDRYGYAMPYYNPYPRPGRPYEIAAASCMKGDYSLMFQYLLGLLTQSIGSVSGRSV